MLHVQSLLLVLSVEKLPEILLDIIGQKLLVQSQKLVWHVARPRENLLIMIGLRLHIMRRRHAPFVEKQMGSPLKNLRI
jgi:hypothetical protein